MDKKSLEISKRRTFRAILKLECEGGIFKTIQTAICDHEPQHFHSSTEREKMERRESDKKKGNEQRKSKWE